MVIVYDTWREPTTMAVELTEMMAAPRSRGEMTQRILACAREYTPRESDLAPLVQFASMHQLWGVCGALVQPLVGEMVRWASDDRSESRSTFAIQALLSDGPYVPPLVDACVAAIYNDAVCRCDDGVLIRDRCRCWLRAQLCEQGVCQRMRAVYCARARSDGVASRSASGKSRYANHMLMQAVWRTRKDPRWSQILVGCVCSEQAQEPSAKRINK